MKLEWGAGVHIKGKLKKLLTNSFLPLNSISLLPFSFYISRVIFHPCVISRVIKIAIMCDNVVFFGGV